MFKIGPIPNAKVTSHDGDQFVVSVEGYGDVNVELVSLKRIEGGLIRIMDKDVPMEESLAAPQAVKEYLREERRKEKEKSNDQG